MLELRKLSVALFIGLALFPALATAGLIHSYRFDSDVSDSTGTADGVPVGGASIVDGALWLDGVDDYVQFASKIVPTSGSYTVALFALQTNPQEDFVELISQGASTLPGFYLGHDPSGGIRVTDVWNGTGVDFPSDGQFHHFSMVVDSLLNETLLYVDGELAASFGLAIATTTEGSSTRLGRQFDPFEEFFDGAIDDVLIYDSALSSIDVRQLAASRTAVPEPTTIAMIGFGLIGLVCWRWLGVQPINRSCG